MTEPASAPPPADSPGTRKWLIGLIVGFVATVVGGAAGSFYQDAKAWIFPGELFGSYVMLTSSDEETPPVPEQIALHSHGYRLWGEGSRPGKKWVYTGFMGANGSVVLSYRSKEPGDIGFGEYFLETKRGMKSEYVGHMVGNFCESEAVLPSQRIMRCNAVMVRVGQADERRKFYRDLLSEPCVPVKRTLPRPPAKCPTREN